MIFRRRPQLDVAHAPLHTRELAQVAAGALNVQLAVTEYSKPGQARWRAPHQGFILDLGASADELTLAVYDVTTRARKCPISTTLRLLLEPTVGRCEIQQSFAYREFPCQAPLEDVALGILRQVSLKLDAYVIEAEYRGVDLLACV